MDLFDEDGEGQIENGNEEEVEEGWWEPPSFTRRFAQLRLNGASSPIVDNKECSEEEAEEDEEDEEAEEAEEPDDAEEHKESIDESDDQSDDLPKCPYGSKCYRKNPQHFAEFSHPRPVKSAVPPRKKSAIPVCRFLLAGWCHKWSHVKSPDANPKHPTNITRCPYLDKVDVAGKYVGCVIASCKYQHPNPKDLQHQAQWTELATKQQKENCFYKCFVPNMTSQVCPLFKKTGACFNPMCPLQHSMATPVGLPSSAPSASPSLTLATPSTIPAAEGTIHHVQHIWKKKSSSKDRSVVSVHEIISPQLRLAYEKRKQELENNGCPSDEIYAFHGTSTQAIQQIIQNGFRADHQINNAYGKGTYFAEDPVVSISYSSGKGSNQMLLCNLLLGQANVDSIWASSCNYYIIPNTSGCLPRFVITFK